jgi:hypothetical protein
LAEAPETTSRQHDGRFRVCTKIPNNPAPKVSAGKKNTKVDECNGDISIVRALIQTG